MAYGLSSNLGGSPSRALTPSAVASRGPGPERDGAMNIRRDQKKLADQQLNALLSGKSLVSDTERKAAERTMSDQIGAGVGALGATLNQQALGQGQGQAVSAGAVGNRDLANALAQAQALGAAELATSQMAVHDQRAAQAMGFSTAVRQENRADRQQVFDFSAWVVEQVPKLIKSVVLAGGGL